MPKVSADEFAAMTWAEQRKAWPSLSAAEKNAFKPLLRDVESPRIAQSKPTTQVSSMQKPVPPLQPAVGSTERRACPTCGEMTAHDATKCPHCLEPIFSRDKASNSAIGLVAFAIIFVALYFALTQFASCGASREVKKIEQMQRELTR